MKKRINNNTSSNNIKNKHNILVAESDTFKISARMTEKPCTNKREVIGTAMERTLQQMPPFQNPNDASEDIVKTVVNLETLSPPNAHFPISRDDEESDLNSDDVAGTSNKRAFERFLTHPDAVAKRAKSCPSALRSGLRKKRTYLFVQILQRSLRRPPHCTICSSVLLLSTSHCSIITTL
jgi:hypothetical protein